MRYIFFMLFIGVWGQAQITDSEIIIDNGNKDSIKIFKPTINDYQYRTQFSEKKAFDTTFTIDKYYQFTQFNNKDNFGKIQFSNMGSGFQQLIYKINSEEDFILLPTKKSFTFLGIKDIKYYDVKTPTTIFHYHNGYNNGGALQSTYTQNIGKRFNFAIEYMGLRSQGFYQRDLASSNNSIFSAHYLSKNGRYEIYTHYIHQNISNEENGGLANLENFISGDSRFNNRESLTINLYNTYSKFMARRYYFSHILTPFNAEKFPFKIKHILYHQSNRFNYTQENNENYYSSALINNYTTNTYKRSKNFSNTFSLAFDQEKFKAEAGIRYQNIRFETGTPIIINGAIADNLMKENRIGIIGNIALKIWNRFDLNSSLEISNGTKFGNYINSKNQITFEPIKDYFLNAYLNIKSSVPSFNYLMNASFYEDYNYSFTDFKNQNILNLRADIQLKWFNTKLFANYFRIDQMAYFNTDKMPQQSSSPVNISQIGGEATFNYGKFHLNTKLHFQSVMNNKELLPLPSFIGRANFYYRNKIFKKADEIQTGIKAYYFSKFISREYFPILNEFVLSSNSNNIGGHPIADAYINFKVKRMLIYAEAQHFNASLTKNKSFAAPFYPIADFRLNLGIVWYLFH